MAFAIAVLLGVMTSGVRAQGVNVFEEHLGIAPDSVLFNGQNYNSGTTIWNVTLSGTGDLRVQSNKFVRTTTSTNSFEIGDLRNSAFQIFASNSWILRAVVNGTNTATNTPSNSISLSVGGPSGTYGWKALTNRTDGNVDFSMGQNSTFNDLYNGDVFTANQWPNRNTRMTFVNKNDTLYGFVDDLALYANPTNLLETSRPTTGTLGTVIWDQAHLTLGSRFTGSLDDVQFYNVLPYIETFTTSPTMTTIDPIAANNTFDNGWNVVDANTPVKWKIASDRLEWKDGGTSVTLPPEITSTSPETDFISDSWTFEATLRFLNPTNLSANRIIIEIETLSGTILGFVIPRTVRSGSRLLVYKITESNVILTSAVGTDIPVLFRARLSITYNAGGLEVRLNDRLLTALPLQVNMGTQNWKRFNIKGDANYGFTVDSILFFNAGEGFLAASDWSQYE